MAKRIQWRCPSNKHSGTRLLQSPVNRPWGAGNEYSRLLCSPHQTGWAGRWSIPGARAGVDLISAEQEVYAKEPSLRSCGPGPLCTGQQCGDPQGLPRLHQQACGPQHTVHTLGWKGLGMAPCPRLLSLGVPILASSFPVTSPSSRDSFSRALWQDLECVCVRAGGEG